MVMRGHEYMDGKGHFGRLIEGINPISFRTEEELDKNLEEFKINKADCTICEMELSF